MIKLSIPGLKQPWAEISERLGRKATTTDSDTEIQKYLNAARSITEFYRAFL